MFGLGWPELLPIGLILLLMIAFLLIVYFILKRIIRHEVKKSIEETERTQVLQNI